MEFENFNKVFDIINNINYDDFNMVFHVVDKVQRGLGREIFVMDIYTKLLQNSIEKFFSFLCKHQDNEIISVSSDRRPELLHKKFFEHKRRLGEERKDQEIYNFVLDCKRWAPHSVLQKYIHFIFGLRKLLPETFYYQVTSYLDMMINKKVFITNVPH